MGGKWPDAREPYVCQECGARVRISEAYRRRGLAFKFCTACMAKHEVAEIENNLRRLMADKAFMLEVERAGVSNEGF